MKRYSESLEQWEQEAYHDGYGADWLADVGEGVKYYAMDCETKGRRLYESGSNHYACHYCIDTGKLRGGTVEDCTVRETGKRKKKRWCSNLEAKE